MKFSDRMRILFDRDARHLYTVKEFAHANPNLLIIVCDPKSDRIFVTHKDKFVNGRIKSPTGKKSHVVREVLKYSRFNVTTDMFITSIMETLHLPIWRANQFYQFIDGAVFNIAKSLQKKRVGKSAELIPSPIQADEIGRIS